MNTDTDSWLDLFEMVLEKTAENAADPGALFRKLGITPNAKDADGRNISPVNLNQRLNIEAYRDTMSVWRKVRSTIKSYGLQVSDELMLAPLPQEMASKQWRANPWLEVSRPLDVIPVRFVGQEALLAFDFINFFIQQCESLDPARKIRELLTAQGITAENWEERVGSGTGLTNPFLAPTPINPAKGAP